MTSRYGSVRLIRQGDREITGAIASGMMEARQHHVVRDEIIRQRTERSLMRVDVGRGGVGKGDIEQRIMDARLNYCQSAKAPGIAGRVGQRILGVYGLLVLSFREYFNFDNARWRGV